MISIEQHVDWIADAMTYMREHGKHADELPELALSLHRLLECRALQRVLEIEPEYAHISEDARAILADREEFANVMRAAQQAGET